MKLWVDDIRPAPEGWVRAHSVTEAIRLLDTLVIDEVSLDHDISMKVAVGSKEAGYNEPRPFASNETFEPVARFIAATEEEDHFKVTIHTANPVASKKMAEILKSFNPTVKLSKPCNRFEEEW